MMSKSSAKPAPGSRPEAVSSIVDKIGGAAGLALAATSITRKQFIQHAVIANLYEIEAARIALQRARRNDVKEAARAMLADHEKMGSELLSFIGGSNAPQSPPEALDTVHRLLIDNLHGASDEAFDTRYIDQQKLAHREAITLFRTYSRTGRDGGLLNLAKLALPVLHKHLEMVQELEKTS
jgi:putative membrane protein